MGQLKWELSHPQGFELPRSHEQRDSASHQRVRNQADMEGAGTSPQESAAASSRWGQSPAGPRCYSAAFACWSPAGWWRRSPEGVSLKTWNSLSSPVPHLQSRSPPSQCYFSQLWQRRDRAQREEHCVAGRSAWVPERQVVCGPPFDTTTQIIKPSHNKTLPSKQAIFILPH